MHGAGVAVVSEAGEFGGEADALVTLTPAVPLAIMVADCAPVALASGVGIVAAVHAGWRGLLAGVVEAAVEQMRSLGARHIDAALGPCIGPECYEFSPAELDAVAARLGDRVRGTTSAGRPALDVPAAVRAALDRAGVELAHDTEVCTACSADHYSHRARAEPERHAMVVWLP